MKMTKERAEEIVEILREMAEEIEEDVLPDLDTERSPCPTCGLGVCSDFDEWQFGISLDAIAKKIRGVADGIERKTRSAGRGAREEAEG